MGFAAGKGWAGLAELKIAESCVGEKTEGFAQLWYGGEEVGGFGNCHVEDFADVAAVVGDFEGGGAVAIAFTGIAVNPCGGEKVHLEFDAAVAFAVRALAVLVVEGEASSLKASHTCFGKLCEKLTNFVEEFHVGRGAGARGFTNRSLVHFVASFDVIKAG